MTVPQGEYEDLIDARDHALALRDVATGAMETLTAAELDEYLAAPTPLAFWRRRRGLTQAALAATVGITQPYLAQIETGKRSGDVRLYARLAKALRLRIEDLVAEE
ncbi:MAG: helix-turn-helix transcriptional regulator [Acetobacteraceae bacterium]|nr:helix-turn-helix transcriptional regulator [Acetobacteraceae bacterium]